MRLHVLVLCLKHFTLGLYLYGSGSQPENGSGSQRKHPKGFTEYVPRASRGTPIKILAFGDSWAEFGPSQQMLIDMFAANHIHADVKVVARSGTRACQWAINPDNLKLSVAQKFGKGGADFIWYSLGGNDLLDPHYTICANLATSVESAKKCLADSTAFINSCTDVLLKPVWEAWPNTKVVQCGYDIECESRDCVPIVKVPYCGQDIHCRHYLLAEWQKMLLERRLSGGYTGLNILGTLQMAGGMAGATPGSPILESGSPCDMVASCVHPIAGSTGAKAIAQAFWDLYFRSSLASLQGESHAIHTVRPRAELLGVAQRRNGGSLEDNLTMCMWDWRPDLNTPQGLPNCKREWEALTGMNDADWFSFMA